MASGKVKWFNDSKGFGFIEQPSGDEIFVHYSSIAAPALSAVGRKTLKEGEEVEFDVYENPKGLHARNVRYPSR